MADNLTLQRPDGTTIALRLDNPVASVLAVTSAQQNTELCGTDTVSLTLISTTALAIPPRTTALIHGQLYTLLQQPAITKTADRNYQYTLTLESPQYLLLTTAFLMPFSALNESYTGTLQDFADRIKDNLDRTHPGLWQLGTIQEATATPQTKTLNFADTNCLDTLQNLCTEYGVEFHIAYSTTAPHFTLTLRPQIGQPITGHTFSYGRQGTLTQIQQNPVDDPDFATRIYFYGGTTNIPDSYFNARQTRRLCLDYQESGAGTPAVQQSHDSYIEQPSQTAAYGLVERTHTFDDIYPNRIGTVTAISASNPLQFSDSAIDFDLNARDANGTLYLIAGTNAKIHFNSGALAGYDFDISTYDHATRTFTINQIRDENNYDFPSTNNTAFRIAVGDEYIITDIIMPDSYIAQAERELRQAAHEWYEQHCMPAQEYSITLDPLATERLAPALADSTDTIFHCGDTLTLADQPLGINGTFRVISVQRNLLHRHDYTLRIATTNTIRAAFRWTSRVFRRERNILYNLATGQYYRQTTVSRLANSQRQTGQLTTATDSMRQQITDLTASQQASDEETQQRLDSLTQELTEVQTSTASSLEEIGTYARHNIDGLSQELTELQTTSAAQQQQIDNMNTSIRDLLNRMF